jgi:hypothetical protein
MGSGFDDWIYWHFFIINYYSSQSMTVQDSLHSLPDHERLLFLCDERRIIAHTLDSLTESESKSYVTTDGLSANLPWNKAPIWGLRPDFYLSDRCGFVDMGRSL